MADGSRACRCRKGPHCRRGPRGARLLLAAALCFLCAPRAPHSAWAAPPLPRRALLAAAGLALPTPTAHGEDRLCPSGALVHLQGTSGDVFVLGVTHLSNKSAQVVRSVVQKASPDMVMVELDASRVAGLARNSTRAAKAAAPEAPSDFFTSARKATTDAALGMAAGVLRFGLDMIYRAFEKYLNTPAGTEMLAAVEEAAKVGAPVMLGDRPAQDTLNRLVEAGQSSDLGQLEQDLAISVPELRTSDLGLQALVDSATDQATAKRLRRAFKASAPELFAALVGERDEYMAANLARAARNGRRRIVAVVGSLHVQGISEALERILNLRVLDACVS
ncbi:unnamed protein product [Symbiodinium natans]|uniref:TraB domain-containing protein n=1 Tax=Symbiodinium natans TaxID=878477 RepID=A0A812NKF8_9DINO|nr:unnamed protein product [Symbiodinium natans]